MNKQKSKRKIFFEKYPGVYYLIYIPLCIILLGWPICGQPNIIYMWIIGWDMSMLSSPLETEWWFYLIMVGSWLTIPIYGMILVMINWWLRDMDEEEKDIDRAYRSRCHPPNPDIIGLESDLKQIEQKYHPNGEGE